MRRIHYGDVCAAARALMRVETGAQSGLCLRMIRQAQTAEAHRRETGRPHPLWGTGSLMEVARCHPLAAEPGFENPDYCAAMRLVLGCLMQQALSQRRT
ncbi:hypothetical protein [Aestuariivita sp.]|jgi:hypothetical protein|uniref:DUF7742 family protein n=1 Tax=Aestuariivita sp. TaxID=1872407 RepID=UPI00216B8182|nr:hypothetical protein [Aestuariivita sp.]MCE8006589.1 hypothetical protein [Aestuariivita sp.]